MDVGAVKAPMIRRSSLVQPFLDEIDFAFELVVGYGRSRSVAVQGTVCSQARLYHSPFALRCSQLCQL